MIKEHAKFIRLKADCEDALKQGLPEKCLQLLEENLDETSRREWVALYARFNQNERGKRLRTLSQDDYSREWNKLVNDLQDFMAILQPENVSLLRGIHDRILVCTYTSSLLEWEKLFPEAFFSHAAVVRYNDPVPEGFQAPDVVVFDDTEENTVDVRPQMIRCLKAMPKAHFLYVGDKNPFKDSETLEGKAVWRRCSNANTQFTVHARLRELLEFRKIYGTLQNL